ncbi:MAG: hypothetical protein QW597_00750 [Thermoplasmataceae archaeon]
MFRLEARGDLIVNLESSGTLITIDRDRYSIFEKSRVESIAILSEIGGRLLGHEVKIECPEVHFESDGNRLKVLSKLSSNDAAGGKVAAIVLVSAAMLSLLNSIKGEDFMINDENNFTKIKNLEITRIEKILD